MSNRLIAVLSAAVLLGATHAASAVTVLFLGGGAGPTTGADASVMDLLQSRYGFGNVTYKQASAANNTTDLIGIDVLVTSSTPGSGDIRNKYHDSAIGIVNWEEAVMDSGGGEFGLSSVIMTKSTTTTQLNIDMAHPITSGLGGTIPFVTAGETVNTSSLAGSAFNLASATNGTGAGNSALFAVDAGGAVGVSSPAEGRRVMFPITDATFNNLTLQGRQLFAQSVDWAADAQALGFIAPQVLAQYTFPTLESTETGPGYAPTTVAPGVMASDVSATGSPLDTFIENPTPNYASQPVLRVFPAGNTTVDAAQANGGFFEFSIDTIEGTEVDLSELYFDAGRGGGSTPRGWGIASSLDNFATILDTEAIATQRPDFTTYFIDLSDPMFQNLTEEVTFRMYAFSPSDGSTIEFDNITVLGRTTSAVPEPATAAMGLLSLAALAMRRRRAA